MAKTQSYILCTSPRSGSTLLCKLLAATRQAGKPESYFHDPSLEDWLHEYGLTPDPSASEQNKLAAVFAAVRTRGAAGTGLFGLRLQRGSFDYLAQKLGVLHAGHSSDAARFEAAFGQTLFIHLTRLDKLEQAISLTKAGQTGLWHQAPDGTELERLSAPQEPAYDRAMIAQNLKEVSALDRAWSDWFAQEKVEPLRITYEELSHDPQGVLMTALEALGVNRKAAQNVRPGVAKLADEQSRLWKQRFLIDQAS